MSSYEYEYFDGEYFHTFNIIEVDSEYKTATIAITCAGKISVQEFDLLEDENGLYFEYGPLLHIIHFEDFESVR